MVPGHFLRHYQDGISDRLQCELGRRDLCTAPLPTAAQLG